MEKVFEKNKDFLRKSLPHYSDEQIMEFLSLRKDFWKMIIDTTDLSKENWKQ